MSTASLEIQILARKIIAYEAARNSDSDPHLGAASSVLEILRQRLCGLAGVDGFRVLLARALALSKAKTLSLGKAQVGEDARLVFDESDLPGDASEADANGLILITHLLDLLMTFIGGSLTFRLVSDEWPEAALDGIDLMTEEQR